MGAGGGITGSPEVIDSHLGQPVAPASRQCHRPSEARFVFRLCCSRSLGLLGLNFMSDCFEKEG